MKAANLLIYAMLAIVGAGMILKGGFGEEPNYVLAGVGGLLLVAGGLKVKLEMDEAKEEAARKKGG